MHVELIVVPWDSARRGERMGAGPERLLAAGLPRTLEQLGCVVTQSVIDPPEGSPLAEIRTAFELARAVAEHVRTAREAGRFPLVLSGNCGVASGVVAGLGADTAVLWFDAHGDFNTPETTTGGFLDGMALARLTGRCWRAMSASIPGFAPVTEKRVLLLGARDLDPLEERALGSSALRRVAAAELGPTLGERVRRELAGAARTYLHLDLDVLDPAEGRVNQYAAPGGVSLAALRGAIASLRATAMPAAMTLSAYDPAFDLDGRVARAALEVVRALLQPVA
jgi:arginase